MLMFRFPYVTCNSSLVRIFQSFWSFIEPYNFLFSNPMLQGMISLSQSLSMFHSHVKLAYSMAQSPFWEANWFAAIQEIPRISRNPKVHYRTHKRPPHLSILGQPNPVHIPTFHLLEICSNTHLSTPRSPQWSPSLRFPQQEPKHSPLLTHTRHMPSPSHSSPFYHPHNIDTKIQV